MTPTLATRSLSVILLTALLLGATVAPSWAGESGESCERDIPWWATTAVIGATVGATMLLDDEINESILDSRNEDWETFADITRPWGEWTVYVPVGLGLTATGWVVGNDAIRDTGARVSVSIAVSALLEGIGKYSFARRRPSPAVNSRDFEFFAGQSSFPSGHATVAFALSKSLSDDINRRWATVSLYTIATAASYARLIDNKHWASDMVAGAAVGYFSAVLVRSKILRPDREGPEVSVAYGGPGLTWRF